MSWSLGETAALALNAARGAGMSWGLAEETAASVVWLHGRGLPGMSALCRYLGSTDIPRTEGLACPINTGCALIDGTMEAPQRISDSCDLGLEQAPLLLLPFVMRLDPDTIWLHAPGLGRAADRTDGDSWQSHCLRCAASCRIEYRDRPQIDPARKQLTRLGDQFACCVDRPAIFTHRIYAPATGQSRMSGAGAGLTDND